MNRGSGQGFLWAENLIGLLMGPILWQRKRGYDVHRNPFIVLVAGTGFEPVTFGL
jgi:hypothetical protein